MSLSQRLAIEERALTSLVLLCLFFRSLDRRWKNYLIRATHRFELYFGHILCEQNTGVVEKPNISEMDPASYPAPPKEGFKLPNFLLPPIDVAIIWHSYLLNPLRAWEDSKRIKGKELLTGANFPLESLVSTLFHLLSFKVTN